MLLIVSPNLCLDRVIVVPGFTPGDIHRAESVTVLPGGKGMNAARVAAALGARALLVGIAGGAAGRSITRGARAQGIRMDAVHVDAESRTCTLIVDPGRRETVINEPGPEVGAETVEALAARIRARLARAEVVVLTGSLPPGMPPGFYAGLVREAGATPLILDTSGEALRLALEAKPYLVKVNRKELEGVVRRSLTTQGAVQAAAGELVATGAQRVLITLGADGALLAATEGQWVLIPHPVQPMNAVGAGDSLTAGLAVGLLKNLPLLEAARLGMAAAAADVTTLLPGTVDASLVAGLLPGVTANALG